METFRVWHIKENVDIKYDIEHFALPLGISVWTDVLDNRKTVIVDFLCFAIRIKK